MKNKQKKFIKLLKNTFKVAPQLSIKQALANLGGADVTEGNYFSNNCKVSDEKTIQEAKAGYKKVYHRAFKGHSPIAQETNDKTTITS